METNARYHKSQALRRGGPTLAAVRKIQGRPDARMCVKSSENVLYII